MASVYPLNSSVWVKEQTISGTTIEAILREICALKILKKNSNIVELRQIVKTRDNSILLYLERLDMSLHDFIQQADASIHCDVIREIRGQIIAGLEQCHKADIVHGDVKPANILLARQGAAWVVKLSDFGLARKKGKRCLLGSRWYKSFEQLMAAHVTTGAVDIWALGCVVGELVRLGPLFPGKSDIHQLSLIHAVLGSVQDWPEVATDLEDYEKIRFPQSPGCGLEKRVPKLTIFVQKCLTLNPNARIDINELLVWTETA